MNVLRGREVQTPCQLAPETEETLPESDLDRLQAQADLAEASGQDAGLAYLIAQSELRRALGEE